MPHSFAATDASGRTWLRRLAPWLAALVACAVYANALHNGFTLDDAVIVQANPLVQHLARFPDIWVSDYWPNLPYQVGLYRPLTIAMYAVEWALWHGNPMGFHAVNVLLHALVTALVVVLVLRLGAPPLAAAVGGVLFAIHPVHVEAVSGIVGGAEIVMTVFVLLACLLHLWRRGPPVVRWVGIAACFLAGLLTKESAVALPLLLVVVDGLDPERRQPLRRTVWDDAPLYLLLLMVLAGYVGLRYAVLSVFNGSTLSPLLGGASAATRIASAVSVWPQYLRLLAYPRDLVADYGPNILTAHHWGDPIVWAGLAIGVAVLASAVVLRRLSAWWTAAVAWFVAAIFVVSNLAFPVGILLAERTLYLPSVALAFVCVPLVAVGRRVPRAAVGVAALALVLGVARTWTRTRDWKSTTIMLTQLAAAHPESYYAQTFLGDMAVHAGHAQQAVDHYARAWAIAPFPGIGESYAYALTLAKDWPAAERVARASCSIGFPSPCLYLVDALLAQGRPEEARAVVDSIAPHVVPSVALMKRVLAVAQALHDTAGVAAAEKEMEVVRPRAAGAPRR
jgi:protein O-mannosyl-transferase